MLALIGWLVPLDSIKEIFDLYPIVTFSSNLAEISQSIQNTIKPPDSITENTITVWMILWSLSLFGALAFIIDILSVKRKIKLQQSTARHYKTITGIDYYSVTGLGSVFSSGLLNPIIWFDEKYKIDANLSSILIHEQQHIKHFDHIHLFVITFIQRLCWWNPLVLILTKKARILIELSCDQACAKTMGKKNYQQHLARLMLEDNVSTYPTLLNGFFSSNKLNVFRIKQLSEEFKMNKKHQYILSVFGMTFFMVLMTFLTSMQSIASEAIKEDKDFQEMEISTDQIKIELQTNITIYDTNIVTTDKENPSNPPTNTIGNKNISFTTNMIVDLGKPFSIKSDQIDEFQFNATPTLLEDGSLLIETDVTFLAEGELVNKKPALVINKRATGQIIINDENGKYQYKMSITARD
ncbi:MAG: M56 family metallopeptidase [Proteobacteria bacterium]|nr:M56 family metallopeptidase [Pseudomonadota bacterium]